MSTTQTTPSISQRLAGHTAVVTGGSCGIGATVAHRLAIDSARVAMAYRSNTAEADVMVNHIHSAGAQAVVVQADVGDVVSANAAVSTVRKALGAIDILVNNASTLENQPVSNIDFVSLDAQFRANAFSTILVTQAVLPYVPACGGHIVSVSSSLVYRPHVRLAVYVASKAAVGALTYASAIELDLWNITVNAMAPALTRTDVTASIPDEMKIHMCEPTPIGCLVESDDIVGTIAFLVSDDACWITDRTLMTGGGSI